MFKTSSTSINACNNTCDHALSHSFQGRGASANGLTDIKMRWWSITSFSFWSWTHQGS